MGRSITCNNNAGVVVEFKDNAFSPFLLAHVDGLYSHDNNVYITNNTMIDGGVYQGSVAKVRNIVLTLLDMPANIWNQANRDLLYTLFAKGKKGTLIYEENGNSRQIEYYVENIYPSNIGNRTTTVSLLCPDPYFYDLDDTIEQMANFIGAFEFEHEFTSAGEQIGYRSSQQIVTINNETGSNDIGLEITLEAIGNVTNPYVAKIETDQVMNIGYSGRNFSMIAGDILTITTGTNNKHVYLTRDGVKTEVNQYLSEVSEFFQVMQGSNSIGYGASSGSANLIVNIKYRFKYEGA